jgi:hypothetical protein
LLRIAPRPAEAEATWAQYCRTLVLTLIAEGLLVSLLIALANPYGNLPHIFFPKHVIMDTNQRFQYPAVARSGQYDSIVVGTSTSRLLRPAALEDLFGGHFANLAMDSGMAWEQYRMATFFAAHTKKPRTLLIGLDQVWCMPDADKTRITYRGFPEWMFDDNPWNDVLWMFNKKAAEVSGRRIANALGLNPARIPFDGYEVFVPPESEYDLAKARSHLGNVPPADPEHVYETTAQERASWRYPALDWLRLLLAQDWESKVLIITPVHVSAQPGPGTLEAAKEQECKARMASIARNARVPLVDFRIRSDITSRDEHYWDRLHYRVSIAERIVADLRKALATARDDPGGDWKVLSPQ